MIFHGNSNRGRNFLWKVLKADREPDGWQLGRWIGPTAESVKKNRQTFPKLPSVQKDSLRATEVQNGAVLG